MRLFIFLLFLLIGSTCYAVDIASCSDPIGKAYFPELGIVGKKDSGWSNDKIGGGIIKLIRTEDGQFDILYVDANKEIKSSKADGGTIVPVNAGENVFSFLVLYPGSTAEIYTFLKNKSGKKELIYLANKVGLVTKSSLMRGDCSYIDFGILE